jgi:hypothetical protein
VLFVYLDQQIYAFVEVHPFEHFASLPPRAAVTLVEAAEA